MQRDNRSPERKGWKRGDEVLPVRVSEEGLPGVVPVRRGERPESRGDLLRRLETQFRRPEISDERAKHRQEDRQKDKRQKFALPEIVAKRREEMPDGSRRRERPSGHPDPRRRDGEQAAAPTGRRLENGHARENADDSP